MSKLNKYKIENLNDLIATNLCNINSDSVINDYTDANLNENINAQIDNVFYCIISDNNAPRPPHVKTETLPVSLRSSQMREGKAGRASIKHPHSPYTFVKHTYDLQSDLHLYNSETCQSVCRYMCLYQPSNGKTYELQSVSILYDSDTYQSVYLKVCTCHSLNKRLQVHYESSRNSKNQTCQ